MLGLFHRASGTLLAADDDSGPGTLSRLTFTIPVDGEYAIAVSSFPDFEFDGGGEGGIGRYVLDVRVPPPAPPPTTRLEFPAGPVGLDGSVVAVVAASSVPAAAPPAEKHDMIASDERRTHGRPFARA